MQPLNQENIDLIKDLIQSSYPVLNVRESQFDCAVVAAPANGVAVAEKLITDIGQIEAGKKSILMADKIPSAVLGKLGDIVGLVTLAEDPSSHLSIVCRSKGIPILAVTQPDMEKLRHAAADSAQIAMDSFAGRVVAGSVDADDFRVLPSKQRLLREISSAFDIEISANADTAPDIAAAVDQGYTRFWPRSETMLYEGDTLQYFNAFLIDPSNQDMAKEFSGRHRESIKALFSAAKGGTVCFRLLDPPSHEFLPDPHDEESVRSLSSVLNLSDDIVRARIKAAAEQNPMLGHRGARLLLTHTALLACQVESSLEAWCEMREGERPPSVDLLVPFIMRPEELVQIKAAISEIVASGKGYEAVPLRIGAMIEVPSILFYPEEIAKNVDFVTYGSNDLVALMHGISRGDAYARYLNRYIESSIFPQDPMVVLPEKIVGVISAFSKKLREANPRIHIDLCGEQAISTDIAPLLQDGSLDSVAIGAENLPAFAANLVARHENRGPIRPAFGRQEARVIQSHDF